MKMKFSSSKLFRPILMFSVFSMLLSISSCLQLKELVNFSKCEFKLNTVENIKLAGVNVQNIQRVNQLGVMDAARMLTAATQNNFPLEFTLNVNVKNPNTTTASLNRLDWILLIDDAEMTNGSTQNRLSIAPNGGIGVLPLGFNINLKEALSGKSADALLNFGLNLAGAGNKPSRFTLRAKPYVSLGQVQIPYPDYINIKTEFVSN
ncbi:MAG: hypothetical protein PHT69_11310 [Bacteroidales bacterium]|nr:hypothetical protein [Bacteroidales bacterium]